MKKWICCLSVLATLACNPVRAQSASVQGADEVDMPVPIDSNSPAFWRNGKLHWFGSQGGPLLSVGPNQFGPWFTHGVNLQQQLNCPHWIEATWVDDDGTIFGWYHCEPIGLIAGTTLTAPKIGAVVSYDGGHTLIDLGVIIESGDPLDPTAQNGYFAGGTGDCSVILDQQRQYFYILFDNYGGPSGSQGVSVARMAFADRFNPVGKVYKYYNTQWTEPGLDGQSTPILQVNTPWGSSAPDAFWGPSIHWNTYLNTFVILLNHAQGNPGWAQEGVYISFLSDLSQPQMLSQPRQILDRSQFPGWYFFYPQVMGLDDGGTDTLAGQTARLYVGGVSRWVINFDTAAPSRDDSSSDNSDSGSP